MVPAPRTINKNDNNSSSSLDEFDRLASQLLGNFTDWYEQLSSNETDRSDNITSLLVKSSPRSTATPSKYVDDSSIIAKITLLLVVTAVVLIASYKFVVRLFLGYADRKDDVVPDGFSDDEDSAVVKRHAGPNADIG